jgi:O-antigen/teichoic acid export membrane protein
LALSAFFVGLVFLFFPLLPEQGPQFTAAVKLYSLALFPLAIYTICSAVLRGMEFMQPYMWLNLLLAGLQAGLAWWLIRPDSNLLDLSWILLAVQLIVALLAVGYCRYRIPAFRLIRSFSFSRFSNLLLASTPLAIVAMVKILYQKTTLILLSHMQGISETGWFSAAMRTVEASQFLHIAMLGALFPIMSFTYLGGSQESRGNKKALAVSGWFLLGVGMAAAVLLYLFSAPIINLVFGQDLLDLALRILVWLMVPFSINIYLSASLISARQERRVLTTFLVSLVILIILNLLLIPDFGLVGACIATLAAESIQALIFIYLRSVGQRTR